MSDGARGAFGLPVGTVKRKRDNDIEESDALEGQRGAIGIEGEGVGEVSNCTGFEIRDLPSESAMPDLPEAPIINSSPSTVKRSIMFISTSLRYAMCNLPGIPPASVVEFADTSRLNIAPETG